MRGNENIDANSENLNMGGGRDAGLNFGVQPLSLGRNMNQTANSSVRVRHSTDERFQASSFRITYINIGIWEKFSNYEGHLIAKCYFANKKIIWEVLEGDLKKKMEIHFGNIAAMRATMIGNQPGTLELLLTIPPQFFQEANPHPRRHTLWNHTDDFTGGQASTFRRHFVQFPPGELDRNYMMLLLSDSSLFEMSRRPFPEFISPYFLPNFYNPNNLINNHGFFQPQLVPAMPYPNNPANYNLPFNSFQVQNTQSPNLAPNYQRADAAANMLPMSEDMHLRSNAMPLGVVHWNNQNFQNIEQLPIRNTFVSGSNDQLLLGNEVSDQNQNFTYMQHPQSQNLASHYQNAGVAANMLPTDQPLHVMYGSTNIETDMSSIGGPMQFMPNVISSNQEENIQVPRDVNGNEENVQVPRDVNENNEN